jgi:C-terminal processing protease CtpA/Prc
MRHATLLTCGTAALLGTIGLASTAAAQSQREREQQAQARVEAQAHQAEVQAQQAEVQARQAQVQAQQAQVQAQQDQAQDEQRRLQEELQRASDEMEEAAREVARLSMQLAEPFAREMSAKWGAFGRRARLGLNPEDTELGVRVAGVSPNGPAAEAGIEVGDVIVEIDGAALADPRVTSGGKQSPSELLLAQMRNVEPGGTVSLKLVRDGQEREVEVQTAGREAFYLDALPALSAMPAMPAMPNPRVFVFTNRWRDMQLAPLTPELGSYFGAQEGLLVVRGPDSDALGLRDGDVILDIGGRKPTTPEHAIRILSSFEEGETLRINIMRRQQRQTLEFALPSD